MKKGNYYIVKTDMAGVWFGKYLKLSGFSICLIEARRIFDSSETLLTFSEIALNGVNNYDKIMKEYQQIWLDPICDFECSETCIDSIQSKSAYTPQLNETSSDIDVNKVKKLYDIYSSCV
jgi:hypothetical protein